MFYRIIYFCLLFVVSLLYADSFEQPWLGYVPSERFASLTQFSSPNVSGYQEAVAYLKSRGVEDVMMENLIREDLFHIAHALSILFEQDSTSVLHNLLGKHFTLVEDYNTHIDHVGRELYGPISFYLPLLEQVAPLINLRYVRHLVFPSTQVVKVLQKQDPNLKGVTIGRVYFQSDDGRIRCVELFQASPPDDKCPQNIKATQERISLLTGVEESQLAPIDHLSVELNSVEEIQNIHQSIQIQASETLKPYQQVISYNPGDGSTQTKVLIRDSIASPFNKIVEFVHYSKTIPK